MDILLISATMDIHPRLAARAAINLLQKGLIEPVGGVSIDEAIADLEKQIQTGDFR